jgi:HK97 gp10 family phage protein
MVDVRLDDNDMRAVAMDRSTPLVVKTTVRILNRAKILCPVDTGNLRGSLQMKITKKGDLVIGSVTTNVNYARFVHDGTGPHKIYPRKRGGVLAFPVPRSGRIVFARYVNHPGTRARPFLRRAIEEIAPTAGFASG